MSYLFPITKVGTVILATGFDLMDPSPLSQFGYGVFPYHS